MMVVGRSEGNNTITYVLIAVGSVISTIILVGIGWYCKKKTNSKGNSELLKRLCRMTRWIKIQRWCCKRHWHKKKIQNHMRNCNELKEMC